jgi:hypothetical protein
VSWGNFAEAKEILLSSYFFNKDYDNAIKLWTELEVLKIKNIYAILWYSYLFKENFSLSLKYFQLAKTNWEQFDEEVLEKLTWLVKLENEKISPGVINQDSESEKNKFKNEI